jgi:hypothetical protein
MTSSLSPENFRLARDRVVVYDFGIAEQKVSIMGISARLFCVF